MSATSPNSSPSALASSAPPGALLPIPQLGPSELDAVARLEEVCRQKDGGRLKLEWRSLRNRTEGSTSDFLWIADGDVVGFVGLYQWRPVDIEICGMVDPAWRRLGIGSRLFDAAAAEAFARRPARALLIVDRTFDAGRRLAVCRGGELDHSEHRMQQRREPEERGGLPEVDLRPAALTDARFIVDCLAAAFEEEPVPFAEGDQVAAVQLVAATTMVLDGRTGERVGMLRIERDGGTASIYGFAVLPERQGAGIGRAALTRVTRELHKSGVGTVSLEVLSTNAAAIHLYDRCGFDVIGTEDYYAVPVGTAA